MSGVVYARCPNCQVWEQDENGEQIEVGMPAVIKVFVRKADGEPFAVIKCPTRNCASNEGFDKLGRVTNDIWKTARAISDIENQTKTDGATYENHLLFLDEKYAKEAASKAGGAVGPSTHTPVTGVKRPAPTAAAKLPLTPADEVVSKVQDHLRQAMALLAQLQ